MPPLIIMVEPIKCKGCGASISSQGCLTVCEYCGTTHIVNENSNASFAVKLGYLIDYSGVGEDIILPYGVKYVSASFFKGNKGVRSVIFPETLVEIEDDAFMDCENLKKISLPKSLEKIGNRAFKNTGLLEVYLSNSIKSMGEEVFMGCKYLEKLTIEKGFEYPLTKVFKMCRALQTIKISKEDFFFSLKSSIETQKHGDKRPTYFDAFQGTPYFRRLYDRCVNDKVCPYCNGELKKKVLKSRLVCKTCNHEIEYSYY